MPGETTYLSRPVFDWAIDWADTPAGRISFDLRTISLGFGKDKFWTPATYAANGWRFSVVVQGAEEIHALDLWLDALSGTLVGFWFPAPTEAGTITAGINSTSFKWGDVDRSITTGDFAEIHLWFTKDGETPIAAKVSTVVDNGDGTETVTLTAATSQNIDETWEVVRLEYVRLATDAERGTFIAEQTLRRAFEVIELPEEYATAETGQRPLFLYHFWTEDGGSETHWRFTSFAWDIDDGTNTWTAKAITHGSIDRSMRSTGNQRVTIETEFESGNPLYQLVPCAMAMPLFFEVREADFSTPGTQTVRFLGRISGANLKGKVLTAEASAIEDVLGGAVPALVMQPRCNWRIYSTPCGVSRASFEKAATISSISDRSIVVAGAALAGLAADWFAEGFLETGTASEFERRTILTSTAANGSNEITLTLNHRLFYGAATDAVTLLPGCDGKAGTCSSKFANYRRFGGHRWALKNLTLRAMDIPEIDASKK